ncbi:MAG: hypothetical protein J0I36_19465, partial [Pandoraea sp.]|nr:hypothetical protein [Pandoraea sp.]
FLTSRGPEQYLFDGKGAGVSVDKNLHGKVVPGESKTVHHMPTADLPPRQQALLPHRQAMPTRLRNAHLFNDLSAPGVSPYRRRRPARPYR